jgi:hypothetical protein
MRPDFTVRVMHQGKPLAGVSVRITRGGDTWFSEKTSSDGTVNVQKVPAGEYWLSTELLGISGGGQCFHVSERTTRKAKRNISYGWGDMAPATSRIAGKLIDSQPGTGGTPIWNFLHSIEVPITGANLKIQEPTTGVEYRTISDQNGGFEFNSIPNGIYVLHAEGGQANDRPYDSTDLMIELAPSAKPDKFFLVRRKAGFGSCGGTSLEFRK